MNRGRKKIAAAVTAVLAYIAEEARASLISGRDLYNRMGLPEENIWAISCRPKKVGFSRSLPWRFSQHPGRGKV